MRVPGRTIQRAPRVSVACAPFFVLAIGLAAVAPHPRPGSTTAQDETAGTLSVIEETPLEPRRYTGQKISLDFKDADIKNVLRILADVGGLNLITTDEVKASVTLRLTELPWDQVLDVVLRANGLEAVQEGNVLRVSTSERIKRERDAMLAAKRQELELEPLEVRYFTLNYAKAKDIAEKLKSIVSNREGAGVVVDERTNTVVVRDVERAMLESRELIETLDTQTPQVSIETHIVEASENFARNLGASLALARGGMRVAAEFPPGGNFNLDDPATPLLGGRLLVLQTRLGAFRDLTAALSSLEEEGKVRIVSKPRVVTLNNLPSTIESVEILRVKPTTASTVIGGSDSQVAGATATEKIPVGIILTVTPQVSGDGFISLDIQVKSSTLGSRETDGIPSEVSRSANSRVLIRDGDTVVIGGIFRDKRTSGRAGFPYLMDIPGLGWLFKRVIGSYDKEELMVFITPKILHEGTFPPVTEEVTSTVDKKG